MSVNWLGQDPQRGGAAVRTRGGPRRGQRPAHPSSGGSGRGGAPTRRHRPRYASTIAVSAAVLQIRDILV